METQRQTVISNFQQFNQEMTSDLKHMNSVPLQEMRHSTHEAVDPHPHQIGDVSSANQRDDQAQNQIYDDDNEVNHSSVTQDGVEYNFFDPYRQIDGSQMNQMRPQPTQVQHQHPNHKHEYEPRQQFSFPYSNQ